MRGQWTELAAIALALVLIAVACGPSAAPTALPTPGAATTAFPTGTFTSGEDTLEFKTDGSYTLLSGWTGEGGTYTVTGNQIVVKTVAPGLTPCEDPKGIYTWAYDGMALSFKPLDDGCSWRQTVVSAEWFKKP